jgi:phospholipid-binding lipoprotein MlaA
VTVAALALALSLVLAGDPPAPTAGHERTRVPAVSTDAATSAHSAEDPLEGLNRGVYRLNQTLDKFILRPVATTYRRLLSAPIRRGVHNALRNWDEPGVVVNDVLQRRFSDAGRATYRFGINTTVGLVGFFDVATDHGVIHHENGFALTLARYGMSNGPYLYLPFAGPSTARELLGALVDIGTNPLTNIRHIRSKTVEKVQSVVSVIDTRSYLDGDLQDIAVTATDPYASIRSIYLQRLQSQVRGDVISLEDSPDIPGSPELPAGRKPPEAAPTPPAGPPPSAPTAQLSGAATTTAQSPVSPGDTPAQLVRFELSASRGTEAGE